MANNWWQELWASIKESRRIRQTRQRQTDAWVQRYRRKHQKANRP